MDIHNALFFQKIKIKNKKSYKKKWKIKPFGALFICKV